jgi:hypothetical protein
VLDKLAAFCTSPVAAAAAMASTLPHSALSLPALLGLMLQHWTWAARGCMAVMRSAASAGGNPAATVLQAACQPGMVTTLLQIMCNEGSLAEAAAHMISMAVKMVRRPLLHC